MFWKALLKVLASNGTRNAMSAASLGFAIYDGVKVKLTMVGDVYSDLAGNNYLNTNGAWAILTATGWITQPQPRVPMKHIGHLYVDENQNYHFQHDQGLINLGSAVSVRPRAGASKLRVCQHS